jgi:hypothetical protein
VKRLLVALFCAASFLALAQNAAERLAWTALRGTAIDLSVGADGTAFSLDPDGLVWMRRPGPSTGWLSLPGVFKRIDAASERNAWAVDAEGAVWRYNGTFWQQVPAPKSVDVGVGVGGMAYVVTLEGGLARFDARTGFINLAGSPKAISRVDVDDRDLPWVVLADASIQTFDGRAWVKLPGRAQDISAGVRNSAFMVSPEHQPFRWNAALSTWGPLLAVAEQVAAGPDNKPWIVTSEGSIFANDTGTPQKTARVSTDLSVFTKNIAWRRVQGKAKVLSISAKGQAVALGPDGEVWQWKGKDQWQRLPGTFGRIALAPSGLPMAVTTQGRIFSYRGSQWIEVPGQALDIAITPQGAIWILLPDGSPAYWDLAAGWVSLNAPGSAVRLAVGSSNIPWVVTRDGQVLSYAPEGWQAHDGVVATDLAIGPDGGVFVVTKDRTPARFDDFLQRWEAINTEAVALAVGPGDKPWVVNARGEIYASSLFEEPVLGGGECSAAVGGKLPDFRQADFRQVLGAARSLAIGKDGNVMAIDTDSNLGQWRNGSQRFKSFPGQMVRIAVAPDGKPWGVTAKGEVWRHDGSKWLLVRSIFTARDVAVACNGTVMAAASDESLYKYNVSTDAFEKVMPTRLDDPAPKGKKLALDPAGRPWTIHDDWVYRCDVQPCERQAQRAREIAIGPEGTLLAVDLDGNLQAFNARDNRWDRTGLAGVVDVSVGPGGKPWIVRNGTEVWASAMFNRKEDKDDQTAAATQSTPVNTTNAVSPFTFSTTLVFDEVPYIGLAGAVDWPHYIAIGASGKVMVVRRSGSDSLVSYDPSKQGFLPTGLSMPPGGEVDGLAVGLSDTLWAWVHPVNGSVNGGLWAYKSNAWQAVGGVAAMGISDVPLPAFAKRWLDLAAPADGSVYVMGPDTGGAGVQESTLYRYNPASNQFVVTSFQLPGNEDAMAVEPAGSVWLVRSDVNAPYTRRAFQYINNAFFERPPPAGLLVCPTFPATDRAVPGCIAAGANGSVFAIGLQGSAPRLLRWNAASVQWDVVVTSPVVSQIRYVAVAPDGRPWMVATTDGVNFKVYKAR